jgi:ATP-dependent Lon protease
MNQRNQDSIRKTVAGLLKLLYPQATAGAVSPDVLRELLAFALEMRQRVVDQLAAMKPAEFREIAFDFALSP